MLNVQTCHSVQGVSRCEMSTIFGQEAIRYAILICLVLQECVSDLFGCRRLETDRACKLCKTINDHEDVVVDSCVLR